MADREIDMTSAALNDDNLERFMRYIVPIWVAEYRTKPIAFLEERLKACNRNAETENIIGSYGDRVLYRKPGKDKKAAECFNAIAEGLAILSIICKGGVTYGNSHFEFPHADLENDESTSEVQTEA